MARQPARLPIQLVVDNWNQRAAYGQAKGIPLNTIRTIAKEDINRVRQGYTAMSQDQANVSVLGALGQGPIQPKKPQNLTSIPGNAVSDISGIIRSLPRLPGRLLDDVIHFTDHPGQSLRELGPIVTAPIPVVGPAISAAILAGTGIEHIAKDPHSVITNPISTALSFLPAVGIAGKSAGKIGLLGETGTGAVRGLSGAKEALAAGHPVRALGRATGVSAVKEESLGRLGLSSPQRDVYAAHAIYDRGGLGKKLLPSADDADALVMGPGQSRLIDDYLGPMSEKQSVLVDRAMKIHGVDRSTALEIVANENLPFSPTRIFPHYEGRYEVEPTDPFLIPKHTSRAIGDVFADKPIRTGQSSQLLKLNEKYLVKPFRSLILRGPRHAVHVGIGGTIQGALEDPGMLTKINQAYRIWKTGGLDDPKYAPLHHSPEVKMGVEPPSPMSSLEREYRILHAERETAVGTHKADLDARISHIEQQMIDDGKLLSDMRVPAKSPLLDKLRKPESLTGEQLWHLAAGRRMADFLKESWSRSTDRIRGESSPSSIRGVLAHPVQALDRFEAALSDIQRTAYYLSQEAKGVPPEVIIRQAQKTFVSADALSPIERTILRQVYPFYTFQAHLLRYLKDFPVNHPGRAAIISMLSDQEQKDWDSGLPTDLMNLFYIGKPDDEGNIQSVDIKSTNPFRSMYNGYTLAGFTQGLHPAISAGLKSMGVNIFSASPEIHQEISYNPDTGHLENKRGDIGGNLLTAVLPPLVGIQGALGWTAKLRSLRENDPEAFKRVMLSSFNIPFAISKNNPTEERASTQRNQLSVAQAAVSKALRTGDISGLKKYHGGVIPFQGKLIDPSLLEDLLSRLAPVSKKTTISPKSLIIRGR